MHLLHELYSEYEFDLATMQNLHHFGGPATAVITCLVAFASVASAVA
jgi:hypothetical protein